MQVQQHKAFDELCNKLQFGGWAERRWRAAEKLRDYGSQATEPLIAALDDKDATVRKVAAHSLGDIGDPRAVQPLIALLTDRKLYVRQAAAKALGQLKAMPAVEPLCAALQDRCGEMRLAASESLGRILRDTDDERAMPVLLKALKACFVKGSARWHLITGLFMLLAFIIILTISLWDGSLRKVGLSSGLIPLVNWLNFIVDHYRSRRAKSEVCCALLESLANLVERHPTPELRVLLPELKAISADVLQHGHQTRALSRQAAQKIETLTEQLKNLPLPASAPPPDSATLPRVANAPTTDVERLPRVEG